jgi:7-carboxy-7-deazaguanine synthase
MAFVRLAGCPLNCRYCDTREACTAMGTSMSIDDIVRRSSSSSLPFIEVTGGEPLSQPETPDLLLELSRNFKKVLLETSGAFSVERVPPEVHIVMDVKCPGSGMSDRLFADNLALLSGRDHELKFVVSSRDDFNWSVSFIDQYRLFDRHNVFSPVWGLVNPDDLARWILESGSDVRLVLQLHKVIWPDAKGER